jgi:hypothetical protein
MCLFTLTSTSQDNLFDSNTSGNRSSDNGYTPRESASNL